MQTQSFIDSSSNKDSRWLQYLEFVFSVLLIQGYLISNHLPKEDLIDIALYSRHYYLLPLAAEQRIRQLVIWREVFPQHHLQDSKTSREGYVEPKARYFLLIVGLVSCVLFFFLGGVACIYVYLGVLPSSDCCKD